MVGDIAAGADANIPSDDHFVRGIDERLAIYISFVTDDDLLSPVRPTDR
jgi:hypothetical protein